MVDKFLLPGCFLVFLALKLSNIIDWSWWWVTAPLWLIPIGALFWFVFSIFFASWIAKKKLENIEAFKAKREGYRK